MTLTRLESFPFDSRYDGYDDNGYPVYDRAVGAHTMRDVFAHFFSDGVFSDASYPFRLTKAASGLAVTVNPGVIIINGGWGILPEQTTLTLTTGTTAGVIKYAVFARYDNNDEHRTIYLRTDASSAGGVVPEPVTTEANVVEYRIGYVTVPSNASDLSGATVTNEVGTSKCPYAVPLFDINPAEVLEDLKQDAQEAYDKYYALLASSIDDTTAGNLQNQISESEGRITALEEKEIDPQALRAEMGLGDTLGVLGEPYGGTGSSSLSDAIEPHLPTRRIKYVSVKASAYADDTSIAEFSDTEATYLGSLAFSGCTSLKSVYLPAATGIGLKAFSGCTALESVEVLGLNGNVSGDSTQTKFPSLKYIHLAGEMLDFVATTETSNGGILFDMTGDFTLDLHGLKKLYSSNYSSNLNDAYICRTYSSGMNVKIWVDEGTTNSNAKGSKLYLYLANYQPTSTQIYTDASSSSFLSGWLYSTTNVTYHTGYNYESFIAQFGPQ